MEFKSKIESIGNSNLTDSDKVKSVLDLISANYSYRSLPVMASKAKGILLRGGLISKEASQNIKYPEVTKELIKQTENRLQNRETVELSKEDYDKLVSYKNSELPEELIIYLLLVSGRRFNEIYNNIFTIKKGKLFIDKLSKRKFNKKNGFEIKLILIKPSEFIKLYNKFKKTNKLNQNALNRKVNRRLNKLGLTAHKMRSIYLFYQMNINKVESKKSHHIRVKNLLHHEKCETGKYYSDLIKIQGITPNYNKMTKKQLKELLNKKNINSQNTKGFNRMKKSNLIQLLQ
jgi:hypothetical protein